VMWSGDDVGLSADVPVSNTSTCCRPRLQICGRVYHWCVKVTWQCPQGISIIQRQGQLPDVITVSVMEC